MNKILNSIIRIPNNLFNKKPLISFVENSSIDKTSVVGLFGKIYNSNLGKYSFIGSGSVIISADIGKYCSISYDCIINPGGHPKDLISTSPLFYSKKNILKKNYISMKFEEYEKVVIGNDVWIGTKTIIMGGVTIGNGAIIGANTVVTKNVEPYSIVVGSPGKEIKKRFDENIINELEKIKWWDWSEEKIKSRSDLFAEPKKFIETNNLEDK